MLGTRRPLLVESSSIPWLIVGCIGRANTDRYDVVASNEKLLNVLALRAACTGKYASVVASICCREYNITNNAATLTHLSQQPFMSGMRDKFLRDVQQDQIHVLIKRLQKPRTRATHAIDTANNDQHPHPLKEAPTKYSKGSVQVSICPTTSSKQKPLLMKQQKKAQQAPVQYLRVVQTATA